MRIVALHSHLNGHEWLLVHERKIWTEIESTIQSIDAAKFRTKISKEKTMRGRALFAPKEINKAFTLSFGKTGWSESRTSYWVTDDYELIRRTMVLSKDEQKSEIEAASKRPILSYNQTDFVKKRVAVEIQFGKYSFIAYDLFVKHLAFYIGNQIDVGVEILPMKEMQEHMSSGPGYYEGALYDVARQGRGAASSACPSRCRTVTLADDRWQRESSAPLTSPRAEHAARLTCGPCQLSSSAPLTSPRAEHAARLTCGPCQLSDWLATRE